MNLQLSKQTAVINAEVLCDPFASFQQSSTPLPRSSARELEQEQASARKPQRQEERDEALRGLQALVCLSPASRPRCRCP